MNRIRVVKFGRNRAGLVGSIGYRLYNTGGSITTARTTAGISEVGSGIYFANIVFPDNWDGIVIWDDGRSTRTYAPETHYYASLAGSDPGYIGSAVWSKNANNFTVSNTFGARIEQIARRGAGGWGSVVPPAAPFNERDKKLLFDWIEVMVKRLKEIDAVIKQLSEESPQLLTRITTDVQISHKELKNLVAELLQLEEERDLLSQKETTSVKSNLKLILRSFKNLLDVNTTVNQIQTKLTELNKTLEFSQETRLTEHQVKNIIGSKNEEVKTFIAQTINLSNDVKEKVDKNIDLMEQHLEGSQLSDKVILSLIKTEDLEKLIET